ncbi:DUF6376 family protein [Jeotgalibacillus soli]|uniref:Lipoprotein n=1 Tax=Jeotgalibacillus soli TaxID=889306 RepID=A0A0C2VDE7_9BACL|nr:DUF6376 family protein [Jeotgalibacillus soli]KIL42571.1 hypothetical protein KP78_37940 [Jeotgalibacillus soli]
MKKISLLLLTCTFLILGGCSVLEEVNSSVNYVNEGTEYINELTAFGEEASSLLNDAATSPEAKEELEEQLTALRANIEEFNEIEPPSLAEDIHQSIVSKNEQLIEEIDRVYQNGELAIEQLNNTEIFTTINELRDTLNQIEELEL